MKTRRLLVTKPHKYGTRHLTAGEEYEVPVRHAVALVAAKKARFLGDPKGREDVAWWAAETKPEATVKEATAAEAQPTAESIAAPADQNAIDRLRLEANQLGIMVDGRWGVARLQHEIQAHKR